MWNELIKAGNWVEDDKGAFIGEEVEGRFKGLTTLFVTSNKLQSSDILKILHTHPRVQHIWFDLHHTNWEAISVIVWGEYFNGVITVEVTLDEKKVSDIPMDIFPKVHVVTTILHPEVILMKSTDSINIVSGRGHVFAAIKECLQETKPEEYAKDSKA